MDIANYITGSAQAAQRQRIEADIALRSRLDVLAAGGAQ